MSTPEHPPAFSTLFAPEAVPLASKADSPSTGWKVLVVDDEEDIHAVLRLELQNIRVEGLPLQLFDAYSAEEAKARLAEHPDLALVLLDVVMEEERAGLDLVRHIRERLDNRLVQIVLVTGQPGYAPQREVMTDYEIDGYRLKTELTSDRVFSLVHGALRTYRALRDHARERALKNASEDRARSMLKTALDAVWLVDEQARFLDVNETACRMLDYSREELLGMRVPDVEATESAEDTRRHVAKVVTQGSDIFGSVHIRKDGTRFPVEISVTHLPEQGQMVAFVRDITERKRAEEALRESEAVHRAFFENSMDAVVLGYDDGTVFAANPAACVLFGASEEQICRLGRKELIDQTDPRLWAYVKERHETGKSRTEVTMIRVDGTRFEADLRTTIYSDSTGRRMVCVIIRDLTERKRAEAALVESARFYADIFENNRAVKLLIDPESGRITAANAAACTFYGYSRESLTGLRIWDLNVLGEADTRRRMVAALSDQQSEFEARHRLASGEVRDVRVYSGPVTADGRRLLHSIILDITERKRAESELRTLSRALEQSPASIVITDREGTIRYVNPCFEKVTGYTQSEAVGQNPRFLKSGLTPPETYSRLWDAISHGGEWRGELCNRRKNGELYWEFAAISGLRDEDGEVGHYLAVKEDVTEHKRAETALQEAKALVEAVVENVPLMVFLKEATNLTFALFNRAGEELLGYDRSALLGKSDADFFPAEQAAFFAKQDRMVLVGDGEVLDIPEEPIQTAKKGLRWLHTRKVPIRTREGVSTYLLGISEDITDRKRAEAERAKLEGQLHQAQKMESVGRLAGGVAHDFNNMLGVILGNTDVAMEQVDPASPLHGDLEEIREAARRSVDLTRQLLAFARKQTITPKVLDLNDTVSGMLRLLERLIGEDVRVTWLPGEGLWPVKVDPSQIDQTLTNLCVNARDAISGVGKLTIETGNVGLDLDYCADHEGAVPGDYVWLSVSDSGCGMDKKTQERLFEPFFTTKDVGKGTGLGLATVYGIVKQNNGFIEVDSEPGRGTTFKIHLPRHQETAGQARADSMAVPASRGHETVLLVEDEASILRLTKRMLEQMGYTVLTASRPGNANRMAEAHSGEIHLLMTDVVMPEMNGRDLAKNLLARRPGMKRLFMSGYTADVIASHGVLDEGVNFIQKPFSKSDLAAKVREVLDGKAAK